MEAIDYEGVEVDRCKTCRGSYFDTGEFADLIQLKAGHPGKG
jgi:Zn-finger nucleic acid-binding protein